jgi:hypothetical protein
VRDCDPHISTIRLRGWGLAWRSFEHVHNIDIGRSIEQREVVGAEIGVETADQELRGKAEFVAGSEFVANGKKRFAGAELSGDNGSF